MATTTRRHVYWDRPMAGHDVNLGFNEDPRKALQIAARVHLGWQEERQEPSAYEPAGRQLSFAALMPSDLSVGELETAVRTLRAQSAKFESDKLAAIELAREEHAAYLESAGSELDAAIAVLAPHANNTHLAPVLGELKTKRAGLVNERFRKSDVHYEREPGSLRIVLDACEGELAAQLKVKAARRAELRALLSEAGAQLA